MQVKTFSLSQEEEANKFIDSVVVSDGGVQVVDNTIVVFYTAEKDIYERVFVTEMVDNLKRNLFHEEIRKIANEAETKHWKDKGTNLKEFDGANSKARDIEQNITIFTNKIEALEAWIANNS